MSTVAVIGAGIVGVSTALRLLDDGHRVILVDRLGPAEGTSYGNAGVLASNSIVPVTVPGLAAKAPRMALTADSPLFMRWSYLPRMLPWLRRYLSHCTPETTARIAAALAPIIGDSLEDHQALAAGTPAERWLTPSDYVFAYANRAAFEADRFAWSLRREHGFEWQVLEGQAARDYDPALAPELCLVRCGQHGHIKDPGRYVCDLAAHFEARGGQLRTSEVRGFVTENGTLQALATSDGPLVCDTAVLTAGVWSKPLADQLGMNIPMETERGYHVEFFSPSVLPRAPSMLASCKFVATPMDGRLRCAGLVEFGGLDAGPSEAPFAFLKRHVEDILPGFQFGEIKTWMGHRPAPADSIPIIGPAPALASVYMGFGHHHVGLTGGPRTGRLLADLIAGRTPNIDMTPYAPARFAHPH